MGALGRARRVVAPGVEWRALVEGERDVGAERRLDLHRRLGAHEALPPVDVRAEAHALLGDRQDAALAVTAAALDLLGHRAVAHREHLEAAGVRDDRPPPAHELVEAAEARDQLVAGLEEEVEGVAEHHLVPERLDLGRGERLDRGGRGERDERRRPHVAVRQTKNARAGLPGAGVDLERTCGHAG